MLEAFSGIQRARDESALLRAALDAARTLAGDEAALLHLDGAQGGRCVWRETPGEEPTVLHEAPPEDSILTRCRERRECLLSEDEEGPGPLRGTVLAAPLRFGAEDLGAIAVASADLDEGLLPRLGEQIAFALLDLEERKRYARQSDRLQSILQATLVINSTLQLDRLLELLMDIAVELTDADAGSLLLKEESHDRLFFKVARGESEDEVKAHTLEVGEGIAGWVAKHGEPVEVADAHEDERFSPRIDEATGLRTRAILCVPLKTHDEVVGAIEVVRHKNREPFDAAATVLLSSLASQAAISIKNALLYRLAITDALTGLYSYRYYQDAIRRETKLAEKNGGVVSLLLLDIDRFKDFNDTHGHKLGDQVLCSIADVLRQNLRDTDVVARYGGEEMVVILRDTPKETAMRIAERIRERIEGLAIDGPDGEELHVTASMGVSAFPTDTPVAERLFYLVDTALYAAKEEGRNRVVAFRRDLVADSVDLG